MRVFFPKLIASVAMCLALLATGVLPVVSVQPAVAASASGPPFETGQAASSPRILIVHDQVDDPQLGRELTTLLGHFMASTLVTESQFYEPGSISEYDAVFYLGGTHKEVSPEFLDDVYSTDKPVVWMGRGLEWMQARHSLSKYGFHFLKVDASGNLNSVNYKDTDLRKTNPVSNIVAIDDLVGVKVLAWMTGVEEQQPYLIQSGNFWYFADIPMVGTDTNSAYAAAGATEDSAYLVLADALHDILGQDDAEEHFALLRIEDVHPNIDLDRLNSVVDYLYNNGIPFGIGLVSVYKNPETGEEVHLRDRPEFVEALKTAQAKGAVIVMHGYTHQRTGETVVDYEFWDRETHAPPADESAAEIRGRINSAMQETSEQGIYPSIWETPHYAASDLTHGIVAEHFGVVWERREAPFFPYPVYLSQTGQLALPETLGYVNPAEGNDAQKLLDFARKQLVVRDAYAAAFIHPVADQKELKKLVNGLEEMGYKFVSPAQTAGLAYTPAVAQTWVSHTSWTVTSTMRDALGDAALDERLLTFIAFFIIFYYWGIFLLSRKPRGTVGTYNPDLHFVIVVPCLNEELVIGKTLEHLLSVPAKNMNVLVVDDDSDDRTREIVLSFKDERVGLLDHPHQIARQGKGRVLNYAFNYLMETDPVKQWGTDNVVIGVLDADGRIESNIIEAVNPYFDNPKAAAVQVGVRISNAATNTLTKWQNFEFLTFARISQKAREHLGSVGLGGNGQFVRLSALASLGERPWTDCLTEDLDLGIRLMLKGWTNHYCPDSFVSQQGVPAMRALIRQRTRWFQGHLTCWRHIPALLGKKAPLMARTDTIYYLLAPVLVFLFMPGSILFVFWSIYFLSTGSISLAGNPLHYLPAVLIWYLFSFGALPTVVWTFWREEKGMSAWRAFLWAHFFAFFYVIWFVAGVKAIYRLARGEGAWAKTARTEEMPEA